MALRVILVSIVALLPLSNTETDCSKIFTNIGASQVLYVNQKLRYTDAERRCKEGGSALAEIWSEEEYREVTYFSWPLDQLLKKCCRVAKRVRGTVTSQIDIVMFQSPDLTTVHHLDQAWVKAEWRVLDWPDRLQGGGGLPMEIRWTTFYGAGQTLEIWWAGQLQEQTALHPNV